MYAFDRHLVDAFGECPHYTKHESTCCGGCELAPLSKKELALQLWGRQLPDSAQLLALRFQRSFRPMPRSSSAAQVSGFCAMQRSIRGQALLRSSLLSWLWTSRSDEHRAFLISLPPHFFEMCIWLTRPTHVYRLPIVEILFSRCEVCFFIKDLRSFWVFPLTPMILNFSLISSCVAFFIVLLRQNIGKTQLRPRLEGSDASFFFFPQKQKQIRASYKQQYFLMFTLN